MSLAAQCSWRGDRKPALHRRAEPGWQGGVPNITQYKLKTWSEKDIANTLNDGMTPDADLVGGSMIEVVANTSKLTAADREAIATYIKSLRQSKATRPRKN